MLYGLGGAWQRKWERLKSRGGGQGSHNKPIGCGASGAYAPGPDDEEASRSTYTYTVNQRIVCSPQNECYFLKFLWQSTQSLKPSDMWQYVVGIKVPVFWSNLLLLWQSTQSLKPSDMWQYVVGIKVPVFWSNLLPLFPSIYLKTAAGTFKMFVRIHHATWDRIPQGNVNILLMSSLVNHCPFI